MDKERRESERREVSISCTVTHQGETTKGKLTNISQSGAFITELLTVPPPEKAAIKINFKVGKEEVEINASVDSSIVRNFSEIGYGGIWGSIGIRFKGHSLEEKARIKSILRLIVRFQQERDMLASRLRES